MDEQKGTLSQRGACSGARMGLAGEETRIRKGLFLCKTDILKALAKDAGRFFSPLDLSPFPVAVPLRHVQGLAGTEEKKEPLRQGTTVSRQSPGLGVVVGFNSVCVSFLRVIRCDSVGKQKQPLKHGGAFSLQGRWGWGEKGALHHGSGEHLGRAPELPSDLPWLPGGCWLPGRSRDPQGAQGSPCTSRTPHRAAVTVHTTPICQQEEGACHLRYYCFCYSSVISAIVTAGSRLPVCGKAG